MAPPLLGENARQKFTGNVTFYQYQYLHRQRVFLPRNVNAVVAANEASRGKKLKLEPLSRDASAAPGAAARYSSNRSRPRRSINQIFAYLQPSGYSSQGGGEEPRLKIEVKSLRLLSNETPHLTRNFKPISFRCRVLLRVFYLPHGIPIAHLDATHLLMVETQMCTITYKDARSAAVEMDDFFIIKLTQLQVFLVQSREFRLADGYRFEITLAPVDDKSPWPPLSPLTPNGAKWKDPFLVTPVTQVNTHGCRMPTVSEHLMFFRGTGTEYQRAPYMVVVVDHHWGHHPVDHHWGHHPVDVKIERPPTPISEIQEPEGRSLSILTSYVFKAASDDPRFRNFFGTPNARGEVPFNRAGLCCTLCLERLFPSLSALRFHFVTAHELFDFKVKQRKAMTGQRSGDQDFDQCVMVSVDLSKETVISRASNDVPDPRTWVWIKPNTDFDLHKILKGDWSWLNEKKGTAMGYRRTGSTAEPTPAPQPKIDWNNIQPIPEKIRKRHRVPVPRTLDTGKVFVRTQSKRYIETGEELSDSDEDVDEEWLIRKHEETICDFEDIATNEHTFMKLWDKHMFEERIISHCHLGPSLYRFAVKHKELFRTTALMVELWKHCLNHIQFRTIDTEVLRVVMEVVKGGKEEWSSVGKSQWGIGLAGPVVLDERAPSPPTSPVPRRRVGRPSGRHVEEKKRTEVEETPQKKSQKPTEDPGEGHGICTCGNGWARDDMVRCDGVNCKKRWFHRSCFGVKRWSEESWVCPGCKAQEDEKMEERFQVPR